MRKTLVHFFTIADYEEEELWLRKQHRNGLKLVKMTPPCFFTFEECEPEDVIYRLDYKNSEQTEEYMQMLNDFGWEYCGKCFGWLYFRKPASEAETAEDGELFSDNASRVEMVSHVVKTRLMPLCIIFFCCIIPNLMRVLFGDYFGGAELIFGILFGVLFVIYVYLIVYCGIKLKKIRKKFGQ